MKRILIEIINFFTTIRYEIGFVDMGKLSTSSCEISKNIHWLQYPQKNKESWFADPFILDVEGDKIEVLAEEYFYLNKVGRISLLNIKKENGRYELQCITPVLSLASHLSFPYIFREGEVVYVCPENYQSGGVSIYKYNSDSKCLDFIGQIIDDPLVDVQIFKSQNEYYALGVNCKTGDLSETKELRVYSSKELCGKYQLIQTIKNEKKEERGAGTIWQEGDCFIRPAQSCEGGYGTMLIMYKINIVNGEIKEEELYRYKPQKNSRYGLSLHTINMYGGVCVVDGHDYKNVSRISRKLAPYINKLIGLRKNNK